MMKILKNSNNKVYVSDGKALQVNGSSESAVDDVKVDGISVVTDKIANISLSNKVDKADGKGLSTNDFTNEDKTKLDNLENYDDTELRDLVTDKQDKLTAGDNITIVDNVISATGGGSGTTNYSLLTNKPQINNVELNGNKSLSDLGIQSALVSGLSIKTINNQSILGAGNINIQGGGGGDTDEIYSILRVMKTILKSAVFTSDQQSNFAALENLLPDGVIEDGDTLIIRSGVTVVEDGDALQIS